MIVWGSRGDTINLGPRGTVACASCERDRPFDLILQYRYGGLYWVFNFVMERKYHLLCQVCGRGWIVPREKLAREDQAPAIPYMRRWGLLTLIGSFILFGFGSSLASAVSRAGRTPTSAPAPDASPVRAG